MAYTPPTHAVVNYKFSTGLYTPKVNNDVDYELTFSGSGSSGGNISDTARLANFLIVLLAGG